MRTFSSSFLLFPVALLLVSCNAQSAIDEKNHSIITVVDTSIILNGKSCKIHYSDTPSTSITLLILPGWNFSNQKWCDSTQLCNIAKNKGWNWVAPDMNKSIYATQYFPQTRKDLLNEPTLLWVTDTLLPYLKNNFPLFKKKNLIIGLSTGGRGVALICEKTDTFFHAACALSGDFDQSSTPNDLLMTAFYGPYSKYESRWKTIDNPQFQINKMKTPIFLGHGKLDPIVPFTQTQAFYEKLKNVNLGSELKIEGRHGHNFAYWNYALQDVIPFFEKHLYR